jgi:hypothetical protein
MLILLGVQMREHIQSVVPSTRRRNRMSPSITDSRSFAREAVKKHEAVPSRSA